VNPATITFIVTVAVIAAFYLLIVRPGQQEQQRVQATIRDLQVGDEVITTSGFFARVKAIETPEQGPVELVLDLGHGMEIRALTTAVLRRVNEATPAERAGEEPKEA